VKQLRLKEILTGLYGSAQRDFRLNSREEVVEPAEHIVSLFEPVVTLLRQVRPLEEEPDRRWPKIWLQVPRESFTEVKTMFPEDTEDVLREYMASEHPHELEWFGVTFGCHGENLHVHLYPEDAFFTVNLQKWTITIRDGLDGEERVSLIVEYAGWISQAVVEKLEWFLRDPEGYNAFIDANLPVRERFGKFLRKDFWKAAPLVEHLILSELSEDEPTRFAAIADRLIVGEPLSGLTLNDFLRFCAVCYRGSRRGIEHLSLIDQYRRMADGRHEGLLDIEPDSCEALSRWFDNRMGGGHPWEICRGGNFSHISLSLHRKDGLYFVTLDGTAASRGAETIRMALALVDEGIPFKLVEARLHAQRALGLDWIGIVPQYYAGSYDKRGLFREADGIHDTCGHEILDEHPALRSRVHWYPAERLETAGSKSW
jgi:hypothetical protein